MRTLQLWCVYLLLPLGCWGQINEDFHDGDLSNQPSWEGNIHSFRLSGKELQLYETGGGQAYLSTISHTTEEAIWEFEVGMGFNPSSQNFCRVYLISDILELDGAINGYYVQIGGSGDAVSLYRQDKLQHVKIIDGDNGFLDSAEVRVNIRVTRTSGKWSLFAKYSAHDQFLLMGSIEDRKYYRANYFGFLCQFTSSRSKLFFFDNIMVSGNSYIDQEPPKVLSIKFPDQYQLSIVFNEPVEKPPLGHIQVKGLDRPIQLFQSAGHILEIEFSVSFESGNNYTLEITDLKDLVGNTSSISSDFSYWKTGIAAEHDVIISEIMADPTPSIQLPDKEYLELYNRSNKAINLYGWTIADGSKKVALPDYLLLPDSYLVLCPKTNVALPPDRLNLIELSSWPTLNNKEDLITLTDSSSKLIHFVNYQDSWYRSNLRKLGGWSLEMIDVRYPCTGASNWTASMAQSGGTPGVLNSVTTDNPDLSPPVIIGTFANHNQEIQITFDQALSLSSKENEEIIIEPTVRVDTFFTSSYAVPVLTVKLQDTLNNGVIYQVSISGFADCNENIGFGPGTKTPVGLPQSPDSADLIINEVLFNPRPLGVRFIELYNRSTKALNLKNWRFARWQSQTLADFTSLCPENHMIYPGEYRVFTPSVEKLISQYPASANIPMIEVHDLPALGNKQGSIVLVEPSGSMIDQLQYHENMHHPLLTNSDGVSLERAYPDNPTSDPNNWYSAAEGSGYATPGKQNSQSFQPPMSTDFTIEPKIISPFTSGYPSYARISFQLNQPGNTGSIIIFNTRGRIIRTLVNNSILPVNGSFQWDGTDQTARRVPMGYYIVLFRVTGHNGRTRQSLQTVAVAPNY